MHFGIIFFFLVALCDFYIVFYILQTYNLCYSLCIHFKGANISQADIRSLSLIKRLNVIGYCKMRCIGSCIASSYTDSRVSLFKSTGVNERVCYCNFCVCIGAVGKCHCELDANSTTLFL